MARHSGPVGQEGPIDFHAGVIFVPGPILSAAENRQDRAEGEGPLAIWDIFHAESLELERELTTEAVRVAMAAGTLRDDDLVRPAGTTAWTRLGDMPELSAAPVKSPPTAPPPAPTKAPPAAKAPSSPPSVASPERIPGHRPAAPVPRPPSSDFEIRADLPELASLPEAQDVATATDDLPPSPLWKELGGEPGDVAFPVLPQPPEATSEPPAPLDALIEDDDEDENENDDSSATAASAWAWDPEDDEDDEPRAVGTHQPGQPAAFDDQIEILEDDGLEILEEDNLGAASPYSREAHGHRVDDSSVALPVVPSRDWNEDRAPVPDPEEDEFTFSRGGPMTVEELDLAPMVDVAFQLVLFFMVTATTILYKTLEIPKPSNDEQQSAVQQSRSRSLEDLEKDFVLVEIDASGAFKIDGDPVAASVDAIAERLRTAREKTDRRVMLLSAEHLTRHKNAVLAYDAANEIGMSITIAKPKAPEGPAPTIFPGRAGGGGGAGAGTSASAPPAAAPAPASRPPAAAPASSGGGVPF